MKLDVLEMKYCCENAPLNGPHFRKLKYLHENGCPLNEKRNIVVKEHQGRSIRMLNYLHEYGYPCGNSSRNEWHQLPNIGWISPCLVGDTVSTNTSDLVPTS